MKPELRAAVELEELKAYHSEWLTRIIDGKGDPTKEAAVETIRVCMEEMAALCDEKDSTIAKLTTELEALRSQANEYGPHPGPIATASDGGAELLEAMRCVRCALNILRVDRARQRRDADLSEMESEAMVHLEQFIKEHTNG